MNENVFEPDPVDNVDSKPFDFSDINAEIVDSISAESKLTPNPKAGRERKRWWESKPRAEKKSRGKNKPMPTMPRGGLKPALTQLYTGFALAVMPFDPSCGKIILENAERCAESLDDLAKTNPAVRRALLSLVTTSAWGAVIMAHAPILMALAMHHVPALRERQEKMVADMAEMFANTNRGEGNEK
jgi:hypothetical protein